MSLLFTVARCAKHRARDASMELITQIQEKNVFFYFLFLLKETKQLLILSAAGLQVRTPAFKSILPGMLPREHPRNFPRLVLLPPVELTLLMKI